MAGFLRGSALSVNGLVHLPGFGSFQMSQIDATPDPCPLTARIPKKKQKGIESMDDVSNIRRMERFRIIP